MVDHRRIAIDFAKGSTSCDDAGTKTRIETRRHGQARQWQSRWHVSHGHEIIVQHLIDSGAETEIVGVKSEIVRKFLSCCSYRALGSA